MKKRLTILTAFAFSLYSCTKNMGQNHPYTNALIHETSPYLLQHAHNPVQWYPWGEEALSLAKEENKLLIVSIGYAACHWCHVMEHESFEDTTVAARMNANYISIKVDREERPDIDQVYMDAAQLMTGRGGWPLNVIALPDGRPVFAGTYFPKAQWAQVLDFFAKTYREEPDKLKTQAEKVTEGIRWMEMPELNTEKTSFDVNRYAEAGRKLLKTLDMKHGGRKGAPKFPMPSIYEFLLTQDYYLQRLDIAQAVQVTLDCMADGGIYDHLGGGFARYSVDETWTVPHFEKMLYDNAQLISLYSHAYQRYGKEKYAQAVRETIAFCQRELSDPAGGFYSSLDADSEGEEGKFYVWSEGEIDQVLGKDSELFKAYYGVTKAGNFEHKNILERKATFEVLSQSFHLEEKEVAASIQKAKAKMMALRDQRIRPGLDDKVLTSWNSLMLMGLLDAYFALKDPVYLDRALAVGRFLSQYQIQQSTGKVLRSYKNGKATIGGFLDDYAYTILAFIKLYEATFDEEWLYEARRLKDYVNAHFSDEKTRLYFYTNQEDEKLIARKMELSDDVIPASNSAMAHALFLLGQFFDDEHDMQNARQMVANMEKDFMQQPSFYSNWARLYGIMGQPYFEVAIVGKQADTKRMLIAQPYLPNKVLLGAEKASRLALLKDKLVKGKTLIYVCQNKTCQMPVEDPAAALKQIEN